MPSITARTEGIKPLNYVRNRNFIDGDITYLSPYISRGVISTKIVMSSLIKRGYQLNQIEKLVQELAWRDYFQQNWIALKESINEDIKQQQKPVNNHFIPTAIVDATTGIKAIDEQIKEFYKTGYLHNHLRMYIASVTSNIANSHWKTPAKWMYYHLLDGDWGSNAASWQWVAGTNSNKKYIANQENINKYCYSSQKDSFLDISYEELAKLKTPVNLEKTTNPQLETPLPKTKELVINQSIPTLLYTYYNLDPNWHKAEKVNRILILEPSVFKEYPVSQKCIDFMLDLSSNIKEIQVYIGEFNELYENIRHQKVFYKEHPLNSHFSGIQEDRDWMFSIKGYHGSFFSFWKKCKKEWPSE
jgi:deoxyribodipyrimidine photo-lyase